MDKLRAMHLFCRTVEGRSFAAAAQSLDLVGSALSKTVTALEQDLGFRLLNRSTRSLSLTEEGAAYYEQCRRILQEIEEVEAHGRGGRSQARGLLRVGMHPGLRFGMLTRLGAFLDQHPGVKVETVITNSPGAVIDDGLDLVLHIGRLADSSLVARQVGWARSIVCAAPGYLAASGTPRHPSGLAEHRAVIYGRRDEDRNTRWEFTRGTEQLAVDVPVRVVSRDGIGLMDAVLGGCGIARPFDVAAQHWLGTGEIVAVLPDWQGERHAISAVLSPQARSTSLKVLAYVDFAAELLRGGG